MHNHLLCEGDGLLGGVKGLARDIESDAGRLNTVGGCCLVVELFRGHGRGQGEDFPDFVSVPDVDLHWFRLHGAFTTYNIISQDMRQIFNTTSVKNNH